MALDYDGTTATGGRFDPDVVAALSAARERGVSAILASGRVLEDLQALCPDLTVFDAVVAENGALLHFPLAGTTFQLGPAPPEAFLSELRSEGVHFHTGAVVVGTWEQHLSRVLTVIRRKGYDAHVIFNRGAVMLLPSGVDKASGVRHALEHLRRSERNLVAFGDAENDHGLLAMAGYGVAAYESVPTVAELADTVLAEPGGPAVARFLRDLLAKSCYLEDRRRHDVIVGYDDRGMPARVPGSGANILVAGAPETGKSWLAALITTELLEKGARLCVVDPQGEYLALATHPRVITLGRNLPLPEPTAVSQVVYEKPVSVVVDLSHLGPEERRSYVSVLLPDLVDTRERTGLPSWTVIDAAHDFLDPASGALGILGSRAGGCLLVTEHPDRLADAVSDSVGAYLVTRVGIEEGRDYSGLLADRMGIPLLPTLEESLRLDESLVGLLRRSGATWKWQVFRPRDLSHLFAHHGRRYSGLRLREERAFRFLAGESVSAVAHSLEELEAALETVGQASLDHHLGRGDLSRWIREVMGEDRLAESIHSLETRHRAGLAVPRIELVELITDHVAR